MHQLTLKIKLWNFYAKINLLIFENISPQNFLAIQYVYTLKMLLFACYT